MKKIDDWFFAGLIAGAIGGIGILRNYKESFCKLVLVADVTW